jgi:hypothetical protein
MKWKLEEARRIWNTVEVLSIFQVRKGKINHAGIPVVLYLRNKLETSPQICGK